MAAQDYRTKPDSQWTYYVVDHLPTMANIYRFDTIQEAINKYKTLPDALRSAIGSSIHNRHEIDHIHKIDGKSVLVRDMDRGTNPIWRESEDIAAALSAMRLQLRVEYEKVTDLFGSQRGSVAIPLNDNPQNLSSYLRDKNLDPKVLNRPLSGINEVFVEGQGWVDILAFLDQLENRPWSRESGYPVPFVKTLNIRYVDQKGHMGQADVSPADYMILRDAYQRSLEKKPGLDSRISDATARAGKSTSAAKDRQNSDRTF